MVRRAQSIWWQRYHHGHPGDRPWGLTWIWSSSKTVSCTVSLCRLQKSPWQLLCCHSLSLYWHSHFHGVPVVNLLLHGASATNCTVYVNFCVWRCRLGSGGGDGGVVSWPWMERVMGQPAGDLTLINCLLVSDGAQEGLWGCGRSGTEV